MAQETKDRDRKVAEEDEDEASSETSGDAEETSESSESADLARVGEDGELAEGEEGEEQAAGQLGAERYVLAGFFAAAMLGAYVLGRAFQTAWINATNKDWFTQRFPALAAVSDDDKGMYSILLAGIVSIVVVFRTYKKPDVRTWADDVASELQKVVWPSRKDVTSYTFVVIVASTVATLYLTLLDRLWAFVTNIVYGDGS
jgi:preprotein translocase subunit SecE